MKSAEKSPQPVTPEGRSRRMFWSLMIGSAAGFFSFIAFSVCFVLWVDWKYPHTNSMAGLAALIYGIPVGLIASAVGFTATFFRIKPTGDREF